MVHVLPVPALASSSVVPVGNGPQMSKVSMRAAGSVISDPPHQLVDQERGPDPERVVAEPVGRLALLAVQQGSGEQVVGGLLAPRADVPLVAVLLGKAGLVEARGHP